MNIANLSRNTTYQSSEDKGMTIFEKLSAIQEELKAPKNQHNSFGGYNYRSCEDILTAVKPLCRKNRTTLILTDLLVNIGDRYYVQATAQLHDMDEARYIEVTAYAREEESKKGMDGSQVTGASSSYARKYALNGLFNIDDVKDSDFTNTGDSTPQKKVSTPAKAEYPAKKTAPTSDSTGDFQPMCKDCGTSISINVHDYSVKKYGAPYCMDCQKNHASSRS